MKKILMIAVLIGTIGFLVGVGIFLYMYYMPHRDVQSAKTDYSLTSAQIVTEYLTDRNNANEKYLAADGNSKILEITGEVFQITEDYNGKKVVILKNSSDKAGVSATFTEESGENLKGVEIGQVITVKGVIRSGASYDEDLGMYVNVILEKSGLIR
jgi:hypothetical protein